MPIYTYKCPVCYEIIEKIVSIADRDTIHCECGRPAKRQIDRPGGVWAPTSTSGGLKV